MVIQNLMDCLVDKIDSVDCICEFEKMLRVVLISLH
jgi:hypothetical protein